MLLQYGNAAVTAKQLGEQGDIQGFDRMQTDHPGGKPLVRQHLGAV
jgi:hypothetical protein